MSDGDVGFISGLVAASIAWFAVAVAFQYIGDDQSSYDRCAPDEVWAWQMAYRPDAENREWECVAISDLKEAK